MVAEKNCVVKILESCMAAEKTDFLSGRIINVGTDECKLSGERGSVYGIAVKINSKKDKKMIWDTYNGKNERLQEWKSIEDNFYPLYWGKDTNMGSRLHAHTKKYSSTGSLQLCDKKYEVLSKFEIIYGAILCSQSNEIEKQLHKKYPDMLAEKMNAKIKG